MKFKVLMKILLIYFYLDSLSVGFLFGVMTHTGAAGGSSCTFFHQCAIFFKDGRSHGTRFPQCLLMAIRKFQGGRLFQKHTSSHKIEKHKFLIELLSKTNL